ncbi:MAG TPA: hypothetical protein VL306_01960, partial [Methylomirabilota bacterium]|nr:hypothetical protein [Methylomirabilota bacterium]
MARLETQINQIYLTHPETKNASLILYEEALSASTHLFILAELRDLQKKSEAHDLKKISEIILTSFRTNKKLSGEALFEASLAQINQNLADIAHEGRKSWVGKFSCIIALRANDNIYLANSGQASGWLRRQSELLEILPAEKRGDHPLKTFVNFIQGKISENDALILTSANVFNYVSTELYAKILNNNTLAQACQEISKILQTALGSNQSFSSFFLEFTKKQSPSFAEVLPEAAPVYAPLPEDIKNSEEKPSQFKIRLPAIPNIKLPKFNFRFRIRIPKISFGFFQRLGKAGKFFFISFSLFAVLFIINLGVYGFKLRDQHAQEALTKQIALVNEDITKTRSALIIKDNQQALVQLAQTLSDFNSLKKLSPTQADQFTAELEKLTNQVNKTSVAQSPQVYAEFKRHPIYLAKSPTGFLLSAADSNSVSSFDKTNKDYFLLN